jgi:adenosylhomocysteine nucleosidase
VASSVHSSIANALPAVLAVLALRAESDGVFEAARVPVLYCGVGKINAAAELTRALSCYRHASRPLPLVVNFGTAGSRRHGAGSFVACHEFLQRDMDVRGLGFALGVTPYDEAPARIVHVPRFADLPAAVCGSGDSFATADCELACDVLDMEAYALAKVCRREGADFACLKYVTDGADADAAEHWQRNVHRAAEAFLDRYRRLMAG